MWHFALWLIIALMAISTRMSAGYKPVFIIHGYNDNSSNSDYVANRIREAHPGTVIFKSNAYPHAQSSTPLWEQIKGDLGREFQNFSRRYPDGFHLIGCSQGGMLGRGLIETYFDHNVAHFISVASPLAGVYDDQEDVRNNGTFLPKSVAYTVMYDPEIQAQFSKANMFNDPKHHDLYLKYNVFLPLIDNEVPSDMSEKFKLGFTRVKKIVMIGGPDDGILNPWQTTHFSFINAEGDIVNFKDRKAYKEDWFGLRTMDEQRKLTICIRNGIAHGKFILNASVIDECIIPYLD